MSGTREITELLESGEIPTIIAKSIDATKSLRMSGMSGVAVERSNIVMHSDGFFGVTPRVVAETEIEELTDNTDQTYVPGNTQIFVGTAAAGFTAASEDGDFRLVCKIQNEQTLDANITFQYLHNSSVEGTLTVVIKPGEKVSLSLQAPLTLDITSSNSIALNVITDETVKLLGTELETAFRVTKQAQV